MFNPFTSRGVKNFERCDHKNTTPVTDTGMLVGLELHCPQTEDRNMQVGVRAHNVPDTFTQKSPVRPFEVIDLQTRAHQRDAVAFRGQSIAMKQLGQEAGRLICAKCPFSTMSALEVSEARANAAEEQLAVAQNELRRQAALTALQSAHQELNDLNASFQSPADILPPHTPPDHEQ